MLLGLSVFFNLRIDVLFNRQFNRVGLFLLLFIFLAFFLVLGFLRGFLPLFLLRLGEQHGPPAVYRRSQIFLACAWFLIDAQIKLNRRLFLKHCVHSSPIVSVNRELKLIFVRIRALLRTRYRRHVPYRCSCRIRRALINLSRLLRGKIRNLLNAKVFIFRFLFVWLFPGFIPKLSQLLASRL